MSAFLGTMALMVVATGAVAQAAPERARDIGIPLDGTPGRLDAITDVGVAAQHRPGLVPGD